MGQGVLLSSGADIDFMVHGVFSYEIFGQTAWITTTHICATGPSPVPTTGAAPVPVPAGPVCK